jgi:thiaminase/transcriptional activator TenA
MALDVSFSEDLKRQNIEKWNKILGHKFIVEIAQDILPISKFVFYLKQDLKFLEAFCSLLAAASKIAYDKETRIWFETLKNSTTRDEMRMQQDIIHKLGGELKSIGVSAEKTTLDYISYLERVSNSGDLAIILSAMAPCPWTYYEISNALIKADIKTEAFKWWIRFYLSTESSKQVNQIRKLLDKLGKNVDEKKKTDMESHFSISCNNEIEFWNMAYSYRQ